MEWPKKHTTWVENRTLYVSIPFTWNLPEVKRMLIQRSFFWNHAVVGGPAIELWTDFFQDLDHVSIGCDYPGALQRINPLATRTTAGCIRRCGFCAVPRIEGEFVEFADWPDLPIICDNNLLASSQPHFDQVIDRLKKHDGVDFNQGIDARLLTDYHAERIAEIKGLKKRSVRLALDSMAYSETWQIAFDRLRSAGIAKRNISSYALVGFDSDPSEAWARCEWIEKQGARALPMWFHSLKALEKNIVTDHQENLGWNDYERRRIMQWFYQHKKAVTYQEAK